MRASPCYSAAGERNPLNSGRSLCRGQKADQDLAQRSLAVSFHAGHAKNLARTNIKAHPVEPNPSIDADQRQVAGYKHRRQVR